MSRTSTGIAQRWANPSGRIFIARLIGLVAALVTVLITARVLGPEGRGHLATFAVLMMFAATILGLGTGVAGYSMAASSEAEAPELGGWIGAWCVAVIAFVAIVALALQHLGVLEHLLGSTSGMVVPLLAIGAGLQYLATALAQLATGLGRSGAAALGFGLPSLGAMVATVAVAIVGPDATWFMGAQVAGLLAAVVALAVVLRVSLRPSRRGLGALLRRGRPAAIGDISNALSYRLDVLLLGLISGSAGVGVYSLATQMLEPIWIFATSISNGLLIRLRDAPRKTWSRATARTLPAVILLSAAGGIAVVALMPIVINVTGRAFGASQIVGIALLPGVVCLAVSKVLAAYNIASGRLGLSSVVGVGSLSVTTALDLVLMPSLGATGAALASTIGYGASMSLWIMASHRWAARLEPPPVLP